MPAREDLPESGWLPVAALDDLEQKREKASREAAERLVAMPPRARVLELMRRTAGKAGEEKLRPADLREILASFAGEELPEEAALAEMFPDLLGE
ncbi:hypothetical protein [Falsiroseomonas tokyonensis]|uniref:Uncharacterized protein n=1 Tax=Falsiroseomonas tokyonensis TaxID=430521 RepID=A0ABV7BV71_9PROT|nr:hypothetical protein [Falsiroseomonas tokyonensis]MBU8539528.1 hypothetical protein [Falsiroseomonas tokyonensis]